LEQGTQHRACLVRWVTILLCGVDLAIKVYKTSILVFKDRDRWGL
jgi:hypothetical protein